MVTSWPLTSRTALKWKKLTRFFYHEWFLDVVVEDWDIRPILLMHFLKWICKWISFQSYWVLSDTLQQSMFDFIRRIFCCGRKNNHWQQDMFTIPCPEEVVISTELSSGLGRRLPCYNTSQCAIVFKKENRADMPEITDERLKDGSTKNKTCSGQSVACEESQGEKKLTLEELMKLSPPGYKEFEAAVGSKDLNEETALQLWEDIFKSLDIFEISKIA